MNVNKNSDYYNIWLSHKEELIKKYLHNTKV